MSISAGQMLIVPPYCHRHFESDPDNPLEFYYITVSGKGSEIIANDAGIKATESLTACPFIERIPQMFYSPLFEPHTDNDPAMFLLGFYYQLMSWHKSMSQKMDTDFQGKSYYYYKQALQYIEYYLLSDITPSSVADFLHISTPYLRKIFAKYNPCSLREYLVKKRIHYAADKLLLTNCTISDVAVEIGYDDHAHFSKLFKKYMGVSPGEYKKNHYTRDI